MRFLCSTCDRLIIENESEHQEYLTTLLRRNDKSFYAKSTNNNVDLNEFDKIFNNFITILIKKFVFVLSIVNLR